MLASHTLSTGRLLLRDMHNSPRVDALRGQSRFTIIPMLSHTIQSFEPTTELLSERGASPIAALAQGHGSTRARGVTVGVVGARGGAGASVLAAAISVAAGSGCVLVDLDPTSAGLDLLLGIEHERGLRWGDVLSGRGIAGAFAARLPHWRGVSVLSWGALTHGFDLGPSMTDVLSGLAAHSEVVILDLSREEIARDPEGPVAQCDALVVVMPLEVRATHCARLLIEIFGNLTSMSDDDDDATRTGVRPVVVAARVPSPGGLGVRDAELFLRGAGEPCAGVAGLIELGHDARLSAEIERGAGPGLGARSPVTVAAAQSIRLIRGHIGGVRKESGMASAMGASPRSPWA